MAFVEYVFLGWCVIFLAFVLFLMGMLIHSGIKHYKYKEKNK